MDQQQSDSIVIRSLRRRLWQAIREEDLEGVKKIYTASHCDYEEWVAKEEAEAEEKRRAEEEARAREKKEKREARPAAIKKFGCMVRSTRKSLDLAPKSGGNHSVVRPTRRSLDLAPKIEEGRSQSWRVSKDTHTNSAFNSNKSSSLRDVTAEPRCMLRSSSSGYGGLGLLQFELNPSEPFRQDDFKSPHDSYFEEELPVEEKSPRKTKFRRNSLQPRLAGFFGRFGEKKEEATAPVSPEEEFVGEERNLVDTTMTTPLHEVARLGEGSLVRLMLASGGDPNVKNGLGRTALHMAAGGMTKEEEELLRAAQDAKDRKLETVPPRPIEWLGPEVALRKNHADPEDSDDDGSSSDGEHPAAAGARKAARVMGRFFKQLGKGSDSDKEEAVEEESKERKLPPVDIPRYSRLASNRIDAVLALLTWCHEDDGSSRAGEGPSINSVDARGRTALHYASELGRNEICMAVLSSFGAILTIVDESGRTPCELASRQYHFKLSYQLEARALLFADPYGLDDELMANMLTDSRFSLGDSNDEDDAAETDFLKLSRARHRAVRNCVVAPFSWFETWTMEEVRAERNDRVQSALKQMRAILAERRMDKEMNELMFSHGGFNDSIDDIGVEDMTFVDDETPNAINDANVSVVEEVALETDETPNAGADAIGDATHVFIAPEDGEILSADADRNEESADKEKKAETEDDAKDMCSLGSATDGVKDEKWVAFNENGSNCEGDADLKAKSDMEQVSESHPNGNAADESIESKNGTDIDTNLSGTKEDVIAAGDENDSGNDGDQNEACGSVGDSELEKKPSEVLSAKVAEIATASALENAKEVCEGKVEQADATKEPPPDAEDGSPDSADVEGGSSELTGSKGSLGQTDAEDKGTEPAVEGEGSEPIDARGRCSESIREGDSSEPEVWSAVVPEGIEPNERFTICLDELEIHVRRPPNLYPGQAFQFTIPPVEQGSESTSPESADETRIQVVNVTVPTKATVDKPTMPSTEYISKDDDCVKRIHESHAERLLASHGWSVEEVASAFRSDPDKALRDAGIPVSLEDSVEFWRVPKEAPSRVSCLICCEEFSSAAPEWVNLKGCEHGFCSECLANYIADSAQSRSSGVSIACPHHDCSALLTHSEVEQLASSADVYSSLAKAADENFIAAADCVRFCPHPGCGGVVRYLIPEFVMNADRGISIVGLTGAVCRAVSVDQEYQHGAYTYEGIQDDRYESMSLLQPAEAHRFCFQCGEGMHWPVTCERLAKWNAKVEEEVGTFEDEEGTGQEKIDEVAQRLWMKANTRPCPQCKAPIEKNDGCNHMTCTNRHCRHEFCWICRKDWKLHNTETGGFFRCNRWQAEADHEYYDDPPLPQQDGTGSPSNETNEAMQNNMTDQSYGSAIHSARAAWKKSKVMARFLHHYRRWIAHSESARLEKMMADTVGERMKPVIKAAIDFSGLPDFDFGGKGLSFVYAAFTELKECRSVLQHSYAFAFFRYPTFYYLRQQRIMRQKEKEKSAFEHIQSELETLTEQLSDIVAREHLRATQVQIMFLTKGAAEKRREFTSFMITIMDEEKKEEKRKEEEENRAESPPSLAMSSLPSATLATQSPFELGGAPAHASLLRPLGVTQAEALPHFLHDARVRDAMPTPVHLRDETTTDVSLLQRAEEEAIRQAMQASIQAFMERSTPTHDLIDTGTVDASRWADWSCSVCTYMNAGGASCAMCGNLRS